MKILSGLLPIVGLSWCEAIRQRLWIPFVIGAVALMAVGVRLGAVDEAARLKLGIVGITAVIGFVTILLAILVAAGQVRRDLDARVAFLLFAKPMTRLGYVLGRWCGVQVLLIVGMVLLSAVGTGVIAWAFPRQPVMQDVLRPVSWEEVSPLGETLPIPDGTNRKTISGQVGGGVRWRFTGLPADIPEEGIDLLIRVQVRGLNEGTQEECLVSVTASPGTGAPRLLGLDRNTPYGFGTDGDTVGPGQVILRHRDTSRNDVTQDFARVRLTRDAVAADGSTTVQLTRLDSRAALVLTRQETVKVSRGGGSLFLNLVRGGLVLIASAGLLTAGTLLVAMVSNIGVTLLAGLTLFFAGSALWTIQDTLTYEKLSLPVVRLLQLAQLMLPDFDRFTVAANLAASQSIPWSVVGSAWLYYGSYSAIFLILAWLCLVRKEL